MNKTIYIYIIFLMLFSFTTSAQTLSQVWSDVETNNLTLNAIRQQVQADKLDAHVGLAPENPEVEFAYLWGNNIAGGNRMDFSVTQSFDFPTAYVSRNNIAKLKEEQAENSYAQQRYQIFMETGDIYYHIVYQNVTINDMQKCEQLLLDICQAYEEKLQAGLITIFEYNKVKLAALNLGQSLKKAMAERDNQLVILKQMNGGKDITVNDTAFPSIQLLSDFDSWFARVQQKNPYLANTSTEMELNAQQLKLNKSMWAPQFFVGYMREHVMNNELFQGVKVGLSLPLWNNVNTIKQTQLRSSALNLLLADQQSQLYHQLKAKYDLVKSLLEQIDEYENLLKEINSYELLQLALQKGEISLTDYLMEYSVYHDSHQQLFELYLDAYCQYVELQMYMD